MKPHYRAKHGYGDDDFIASFIEKKSLFEEIAKLAISGNALEQRMAYIMTDHLVEILLNDGLERVIHEYYGNMFSPELDGNKFSQLRMNFDAKLDFFSTDLPEKLKTGTSLASQYRLTEEEAKILGILHRYRNDMYHRDLTNKTVLKLLAIVYVDYALKVFVQFTTKMGVGGLSEKEQEELSGLLDGTFLYPYKASAELRKKLLPRSQTISTIRSKLAKNLEDRFREVIATLENDLPSSLDPKVEQILATHVIIANDLEFSLEQNKDYRAILEARKAAFATKDYAEIAKLILQMEQFQLDAFKNFESELSYSDFLSIEQQVEELKSQDKLVDILIRYYEVDQRLLIYRDRIVQGAIEFDLEIQRQTDVERGK